MTGRRLIRLEDYRPPAYRIPEVHLDFDLFESGTRVRSCLHFHHAPEAPDIPEAPDTPGPSETAPLILNGENLILHSIELNRRPLPKDAYRLEETSLTLIDPPRRGILSLDVEIHPEKNTELMGLYRSGSLFCTQNESEGFRRITWFPDRPDILSVYTVTIRADEKRCPVLLSNGSPGETGALPGGRHFAVWHDPRPKPCYLFALVAGSLEKVSASYTTGSGREVNIGIFTPPGRASRTAHAMAALRSAMRWDEEHFGFEYDSDTFMIVAVDDFGAGAMENTGLNIFNSAYILADPAASEDSELLMIQRVIAHEFLHNWTGNRVTCRDWFQLTLKEGLTVYRDEEYISELTSLPGLRIDVVDALKQGQFPEDSGPLAHPVKPESYLSVDNLYTPTVYQKGKEIVRMLEHLAGRENFHRSITRYVNTFSGRAVRTEDFLRAVEESCGVDLTLFANWYSRIGTPVVSVSGSYNPLTREYTLTADQSGGAPQSSRAAESGRPIEGGGPPETGGSLQTGRPAETGSPPAPLHIPMRLGLLTPDGEDIPLRLNTPDPARFSPENQVVHLTRSRESFTFTHVPRPPVPSLFRNFSAPVEVDYPYTQGELLLLLEKDPDPYNRWDAARRTIRRILGPFIAGGPGNEDTWRVDHEVLRAFARLLDAPEAPPAAHSGRAPVTAPETAPAVDPGLAARILTLPGIDTLARDHPGYKVTRARKARDFFITELARFAEDSLISCYHRNSAPYRYAPKHNERRRLKNTCLAHLIHLGNKYRQTALEQYFQSDNMSDTMAALRALSRAPDSAYQEALDHFFGEWNHNPLVLDKWFALQAAAESPEVRADILRLERHPAFNAKNTNRIRALYGTFAANLPQFHHPSGSGYTLIAERVLDIDEFNPQAAARLAQAFSSLPLLDSPRRELMLGPLRSILRRPALSANVFEILNKIETTSPVPSSESSS